MEVSPSRGFQRVVQRAIMHVAGAGKPEVKGYNLLVAIFAEDENLNEEAKAGASIRSSGARTRSSAHHPRALRGRKNNPSSSATQASARRPSSRASRKDRRGRGARRAEERTEVYSLDMGALSRAPATAATSRTASRPC
jgi:hypothetical protein